MRCNGRVDPLCVLIADTQRLFAQSLAVALRQHGFEVPDAYPATGADTLAAATDHHPDVVLLSYWLYDMEAPAAVGSLVHREPEVKVIVLADVYGPPHVQGCIDVGAVGFLPKNLDLERLIDAICRAGSGEALVFAKEIQQIVRRIDGRRRQSQDQRQRLAALTPRELEVLRLVTTGRTAADIAERLSISDATVRTHIHHILDKLDARSQVEAAAIARAHGMVG